MLGGGLFPIFDLKASMQIDSHHHFWRYTTADYGWISDAMSVIRRDFLPEDLQKEIAAAGVDGVISVHARQSLEETNWLLDFARNYSFIVGVVGWAPLIAPEIRDTLQNLSRDKKLRGIRHVLHDEPDDRYMLREDFNRGIKSLTQLRLAYDILIFEKHLPIAVELVDRHPQQVFVVDHVAKPKIRENVIEPWRTNLRELAKRRNVYCKISGMVTEADFTRWTPAQLQPYFDTALEAFGPRRLMFGTDWPVCTVGCGIVQWHDTVRDWAKGLSEDENDRIFGLTAIEAYGLDVLK